MWKPESPLAAAMVLFGESPTTRYDTIGPWVLVRYELGGKPCLAGLRGKSMKTVFRYSYASVEAREKYAASHWEDMKAAVAADEARAVAKAEERANRVNPYKVGDILYSSWGYEQTNIDFYKVVEVLPKSVVIVEIGATYNKEESNQYQDALYPAPEVIKGEPMRKVVGANGNLKLTSYSSAYPYKGGGKYQTNSMYGH